MVRKLGPLVVVLLAGCVRAGFDGRSSADLEVNGDMSREGGALDLAADAPFDRPCVNTSDANTVALYTFSGSGNTVTDATGHHHETIVGAATSRVAGRAGCGQAIAFSGGTGYVEIPDSADWDLAIGSIDYWLRIDAMPTGGDKAGIISRDALMQALPGHFSLYVACNGGLGARLQTTTVDAFACSPSLKAGAGTTSASTSGGDRWRSTSTGSWRRRRRPSPATRSPSSAGPAPRPASTATTTPGPSVSPPRRPARAWPRRPTTRSPAPSTACASARCGAPLAPGGSPIMSTHRKSALLT